MGAIIVCDCGGTYTRAARCRSTVDLVRCGVTCVPNYACDSMLDAVAAAVGSGLDVDDIDGAVIAVAGQVIDGEVMVVNAKGEQNSKSWDRVSADHLSKWLRGKPVLLVNDLEASMRGVMWLHNHQCLEVSRLRGHLDLDRTGTIGLVVPGTGLGLAYAAVGGRRLHAVNSEAAHWPWTAAGLEHLSVVEQYACKRFDQRWPSLEAIVSGPGLSLLFECFSEQMGMKVVAASAKAVIEAANGVVRGALSDCHVHAANAAIHCFALEVGRHAAMFAMAVNASAGVILAGSLVESTIELVGSDGLVGAFDQCDWGAEMMNRLPLAVVCSRPLAMIGAMAVWEDKQYGCA